METSTLSIAAIRALGIDTINKALVIQGWY